MNRKGFTLIELIAVIVVIAFILTVIAWVIVGIVTFVTVNANLSGVDDVAMLEAHPPKFTNGQIIQNALTNKKLIVVHRSWSWKKDKQTWDIKVKDGGGFDRVGGFVVNESEVKVWVAPEVQKK